jgi:putative FmdB family regulatory protein
MPIYEYICMDCRYRFSQRLSYEEYEKAEVRCPRCKSGNVQRKIGRIRVAISAESNLEDLSDPDKLEGMADDPRSLGRMIRQASAETGEDLGPEFHEVVNRLEAGQSVEDIEKSMPDLGNDFSHPSLDDE